MTKLKLLATTAVAAISISTSAMAFPINYEFSGHITLVTYGTPPSELATGSAFSGTLSVDSDAPTVSSQNQLDGGVYDYTGSNFNLSVGAIKLYEPGPLVEFSTGTFQSVFFGGSVGSLADGSSPGWYLFHAYTYSAPLGTVTPGPMVNLPDIGAFGFTNFGLTEYTLDPSHTAIFQVSGVMDEMSAVAPSAVPEPGTALLLALPLLALGVRRRQVARAG